MELTKEMCIFEAGQYMANYHEVIKSNEDRMNYGLKFANMFFEMYADGDFNFDNYNDFRELFHSYVARQLLDLVNKQ